MTITRTRLGNTIEKAKDYRFEPGGTLTSTNVQDAIREVSNSVVGPSPIVATAVAVTPYTVLPADTFLYVDTSGGPVTINLQAAAARGGIPIVIKDITGNAATNTISVVPNGAETVDGLAPYPINLDFGGVTLNPRSGIGYTVSP